MHLLPVLLVSLMIATALFAEKPAPETKAPRLITKVEPRYTEQARAGGVRGTVILNAELDETGRLTEFEVSKGLGYGLDEKAIQCAREWRFQPAMRDGVPTRTRVVIEINFRLPPQP